MKKGQKELDAELANAVVGYRRTGDGEIEPLENEADAIPLVQRLLAEGADPNARGEMDRTALHALAASGSSGGGLSPETRMAICRLLVDAGANPNSESKHPLDRTILISAVSFLPDLVPTLLEAGADPDAANFYGETPLHYAASYGLADPVEALLKAGANPNSETKAGESPLHRAAAAGAIPCIEALLRAGADHGIVDYGGRTLGDVAKDDETRNTMARILCEMEAETLSTGVEAPPPARRSRII